MARGGLESERAHAVADVEQTPRSRASEDGREHVCRRRGRRVGKRPEAVGEHVALAQRGQHSSSAGGG